MTRFSSPAVCEPAHVRIGWIIRPKRLQSMALVLRSNPNVSMILFRPALTAKQSLCGALACHRKVRMRL